MRRLRIYNLSDDVILSIMQMVKCDKEYVVVPRLVDTPDDLQVVRIFYNHPMQAWAIVCHSESFDLVPDCEMIPCNDLYTGVEAVKIQRDQTSTK